jgi:hypothetical protein
MVIIYTVGTIYTVYMVYTVYIVCIAKYIICHSLLQTYCKTYSLL